MLQVAACLTMDPPTGEATEAVRDAKASLLKSIRPLAPADVVRGQYRGYRGVPGVAPDSTVETFAAVRLTIDSWRWAGVPLYIRTGKRLPVTACEVLVTFKRPQRAVFDEVVADSPNYLRLRLSPEIVVALGTRVKKPGEAMAGEAAELEVLRQESDAMAPYERLFGDALRGDAMLFARQDEVEAAWRVVDPVLGDVTPVHAYTPDSWGLPEADQTITPDGGWHNPTPTEAAR
jgi:glucose-6-phosphate 1-dehydrogenase